MHNRSPFWRRLHQLRWLLSSPKTVKVTAIIRTPVGFSVETVQLILQEGARDATFNQRSGETHLDNVHIYTWYGVRPGMYKIIINDDSSVERLIETTTPEVMIDIEFLAPANGHVDPR